MNSGTCYFKTIFFLFVAFSSFVGINYFNFQSADCWEMAEKVLRKVWNLYRLTFPVRYCEKYIPHTLFLTFSLKKTLNHGQNTQIFFYLSSTDSPLCPLLCMWHFLHFLSSLCTRAVPDWPTTLGPLCFSGLAINASRIFTRSKQRVEV